MRDSRMEKEEGQGRRSGPPKNAIDPVLDPYRTRHRVPCRNSQGDGRVKIRQQDSKILEVTRGEPWSLKQFSNMKQMYS